MTRRTQTKNKRNEPNPPRRTNVDAAVYPPPMKQAWCEPGDHGISATRVEMSTFGVNSCPYHVTLMRLHQDQINEGLNKILFDGQPVQHVYTREQLAHLLALYHTDIVQMVKEKIK